MIKKSYQARICDQTNKMIKNIANYGLKTGECAQVERNGEYHMFSIKALEDIKPLFIDYRVNKAIKFIKENNIQKAVSVLYLQDECIRYGVNIIYNILEYWLINNNQNITQEITNNKLDIELDDDIITRLDTVRSDSIKQKIEIVNIGSNSSGSVVPESWIGKKFNSADDLHKQIDQLDWRKNKPPVTYCVTHSMIIIKQDSWTKNKLDKNYDYILKINDDYSSDIILDKNHEHDISNLDLLYKNNFVIACNLEKITSKSSYIKFDVSVGVLVSRLQKAIRRGRTCSKVLQDSIIKLSRSKPYNLPELNYIKCSASKQIFWRLLITILEDSSPYLASSCNNYFSMQDLLVYTMIAHFDPDILFNDFIINKIIHTASLIIYQDEHNWDWRSGRVNNNLELNNNHDYLKIALLNLPMMSGDKVLLDKSIDLISRYELRELIMCDNILDYNNLQDNISCIHASNDMHCNPGIILQLQAELDFLPYDLEKHSTKAISRFIWNFSSSFNIRSYVSRALDQEKSSMLNSLTRIHENKKIIVDKKLYTRKYNQKIREELELSSYESRLGFILLFGRTNKYNTSVSGDVDMPFRVKYKNEYITEKNKIYYAHIDYYINYINNQSGGLVNIRDICAPEGCYWNFSTDLVNLKINKLDQDNYEFYVNNEKINLFDSTSFLKKYPSLINMNLTKNLAYLIKWSLYLEDKIDHEINLDYLLQVSKIRSDNQDYQTYKWNLMLIGREHEYTRLFKNTLSKLYNNFDNQVIIGPVDRSGKKLDNSINYLYEGTMIRVFIMLSVLYPRVVNYITLFKYKINKNNHEYMNMIDVIRTLASNNQENISSNTPVIRTSLWSHQQKSADFILTGLVKHNKRGVGDASNVGSGKTLTGLYIASELIKNNNNNNYSGILVLLPTVNLYNTWIDEIKKHTSNFDIILQDQSGKLSGVIKKNSIVITSLARMRYHPVYNSWILCIIDECLSVQNKDALQTEEAWRQVLCSKHGVIMMSATFFRSRFDKLYYMLKILNSNIPETRDYLDLILSENIVCNIRSDSKSWKVKIYKYDLDPELRSEYNKISNSSLDIEQIYIKLQKLLHDQFDYIFCFLDIVQELEQDEKALIYTKSKSEADMLVSENISRYPDKSKKHVVLSYAEGTYGLNDLVKYNTIITRPPDGDKLPQMKGRLDRPGNKNKEFNIIYLVADKTIDEAHLISLDMCDNFYKNHIMPIADLYKIIRRVHNN